MRRSVLLSSLLVLAAGACIAPQLKHNCPAACNSGEVCDTTVGECHPDPCGGLCNPTQRCRAGPPPRCIEIEIGEAKVNGPDESPGASEPGTPLGQPNPGEIH